MPCALTIQHNHQTSFGALVHVGTAYKQVDACLDNDQQD